MTEESRLGPFRLCKATVSRVLIVLAGIIIGQTILFGPSLIGRRILLPVDLLTRQGYYLPQTAEFTNVEPQNLALTDLVELFEPARRFAAAELQAGRLPMWAPYQFGGAPFIWPKFSPFLLLGCLTKSPAILAWVQLLVALVAGLGAYAFSRRSLQVSFWPAAISAWSFPLTGFLVLWQGYPTALPVAWLPWILLAVDLAAGAEPGAGVFLAATTALVLVSGHLDVAAQVLLVAGVYAIWLIWHRSVPEWLSKRNLKPLSTIAVGFGLGFLLAAPYLVPVLEYTQTGARMARRFTGGEERPPVGLSTLPQVVLPDLYGSSQTGSLRLGEATESETAAAAYAGLVATLLLAPLAWSLRVHRGTSWFWLVLALIGLGWCINVPGLVPVLRLPGLNLLSHNRLVFLTSFSVLVLATLGMEAVTQNTVAWRPGFWFPVGTSAVIFLFSVYRTYVLPPELLSDLPALVQEGRTVGLVHDLDGVRRVQEWFVQHYAAAAALSAAALGGWLTLARKKGFPARFVPTVAVLLVGDLLWFAHGRRPQCQPSLYFPAIPVLHQVAGSDPGRVIGYHCLPASLAAMSGLQDIRGYDGVDPARLVELVALAAGTNSTARTYAQIQWLTPQLTLSASGEARLHPILDLLGVRYVIFRGDLPTKARPAFEGPDYSVLLNSSALPRVSIPEHVEIIPDPGARLARLASPEFDPKKLGIVEERVQLPATCRGTAAIRTNLPCRVTVDIAMETAGLLILADLWERNWHAYLNGKPEPILHANHAVRGVVVPAGKSVLEFRYEPTSFRLALWLAAAAALVLFAWLYAALVKSDAPRRP